MRILLVEDEKRMADAIAEIFRQENYFVDVCHDGNSAMDTILCEVYDLIVLDIMLPGKNGLEIVKSLRKEKITTPVLMLTAKSDIDDKVAGLDNGADDYLTKPFDVKELLARVRALGRRNIGDNQNSVEAGDLILFGNSMILSCRTTGDEIRLSEKEYLIMEVLISQYGRIVPRENLALRIWGSNSATEYNNVEVYMSFTRKKLHFLGSSMEIKSVRNIGYELRHK